MKGSFPGYIGETTDTHAFIMKFGGSIYPQYAPPLKERHCIRAEIMARSRPDIWTLRSAFARWAASDNAVAWGEFAQKSPFALTGIEADHYFEPNKLKFVKFNDSFPFRFLLFFHVIFFFSNRYN